MTTSLTIDVLPIDDLPIDVLPIDVLPIDVLPFIINNLHYKDIYNLFYVSKDINEMYGSSFKDKYYHNYLITYLNLQFVCLLSFP